MPTAPRTAPESERSASAALARVHFLELRAGDPTVRDRLRRRAGRTDEVSDARLEDFGALTALYEAPVELPPGEGTSIDASGEVDEVVGRALSALVDAQMDGDVDVPTPA